ncbi:MAG TPA: carbamate kinase [Actinomycetaceae bacterium]|nr:carbamate kinase [Actinomycetaceae bacterium]
MNSPARPRAEVNSPARPRAVVALGGNALGESPGEQLANLRAAVPALVGLVERGYEIVLTHGNGPQVGLINLAFERAAELGITPAALELPECTAVSQGYIGYHLQQSLQRELHTRRVARHVATVVTQVEVDAGDPAFSTPTKPVGSFVSEVTARKLMEADPSLTMVNDSGRGWRRVVASPKPRRIVEADSVFGLLNSGFIVVACGGGGVPVVDDGEGGHTGIPAVIDKDFASALLAEAVDATALIILTTVDRVAINFGTPEQIDLAEMTVAEVERHTADGHFAAGSMLPKVTAAANFVRSAPGRTAVICGLHQAAEALAGTAGTMIRA